MSAQGDPAPSIVLFRRDLRIADNAALAAAMDRCAGDRHALHLVGLLSDGGVHSHQRHLHALIDMAASRQAFIDQSQSLNLFIAGPSIGKLSSMYLHAWKQGLKTTYYLRSRPATRIAQTTVSSLPAVPTLTDTSEAEALACSLENPESCEACQ